MSMLHYKNGDKVWFIQKQQRLNERPDHEGTVDHSFIGEDAEEQVVIQFQDGKKIRYDIRPFGALWDNPLGESNHEKRMSDPDFAKKYAMDIAIRAGVYNTDGTLTPNYSEDPNAYWLRNGVKYYDNGDDQ